MANFSQHDWNHLHDVILTANSKNLNSKELRDFFNKLPEDIKADAAIFGMSDTLWRDNLIEYLQENSRTANK